MDRRYATLAARGILLGLLCLSLRVTPSSETSFWPAQTMVAFAETPRQREPPPMPLDSHAAFGVQHHFETRNGKTYETLYLTKGSHWISARDEAYFYTAPDGTVGQYNADDGSVYPHEVYLSPDHRWAVVERKCIHSVCVAYLYRMDMAGGWLAPVHPQGRRLDEAAWVYVAKRLHIRMPSMYESRLARFAKWSTDSSKIDLLLIGTPPGVSKRDGREDILAYCSYDIHKQRFKLLMTGEKALRTPEPKGCLSEY